MENINYVALILPALASLAVVLVPFTWRHLASPYVTIIHEYGHAVANIVTLGRPSGIKAHFSDGGGVTHYFRKRGFLHGIGTVVSGLSGYPAPILFGLALICSVSGGYNQIILTVSTVVACIFILLMRNLSGFVIAIFTAAYFFVAANGSDLGVNMTYWAGSFFLIAGVKDFIRLCEYYFRGIAEETDLGLLKQSHLLPQFVWLLLMFLEILILGALILTTA